MIAGLGDGVIASKNATIQNAGLIAGTSGVGIQLGLDAAVFNSSTGVITGGKDGIIASGTAVAVTNAGSIGGPVGVSLASGGGVSNTFNKVGGAPVWGTISGNTYAVVVSGGAGEITNGYGTIGGAASLALIEGVWLEAGGHIVNGRYGVIKGSGAYGVRLAPAAAATISNAGAIGAIRASLGDFIGNKGGGTIQSVTGIGGTSKSPLSIKNAGVIGAGASSAGISTGVATYIYNTGTVENGIQFNGGEIVDAGGIYGSGSGNAITFGTAASTLVLENGVDFSGNVVGNAADTLEFAGAGDYLSGVGVQIAGFGRSVVEAGSDWLFEGQATLAGKWTVAGRLTTNQGGGLTVAGSVAVTGEVVGASASGNYPPSDGLYVVSGASLTNSGEILGGSGSNFENGAAGVDVEGGSVINSGLIVGGNYAVGEFSDNYGGAGVYLSSGVLINSGRITGGVSQSGSSIPQGVGVSVKDGTLVTSGTISGASGADAVSFANSSGRLALRPGAVFNGLVAGAGNTLELSGAGNGVLSGLGSEFTGFAEVTEDAGSRWTLTGGNTVASAITLVSGAVLTVAGSLQKSGGGVAVDLDGGLLVNGGALAGGAVQFGAVASTLGITPTASFNGAVAAAPGKGDTLLLEGAGGKLSGLGTAFANFGVLAVAAGADWTVSSPAFDGALALSGSLTLASGALTVGGALSGNGALQLASGSLIDLAGSGSISQSVTGAGTVEVKGDLALFTSALDPGRVVVAAGGTLAGVGAIGAAVVDSGAISASVSVLTVKGAVSGAGTLAAASGGELVLGGGGSFGGALTGAGTIDFAAPLTLTSGASLGVSVLVDTANLTLGSGENLANGAGHVLEITASASSPVTIAGVGADTISNAGTLLAKGPGSVKLETPFINSGHLSVNGGVLTLAGKVTNSGTLAVASGAKLVLGGGGSLVGALTGAGTIDFAAPLTLTSGATLGVSVLVDTANLTLGSSENLTNGAGHVLEITASASSPVTLAGVGADTISNAGTLLANGPGSVKLETPFINTGHVSVNGGVLTLAGKVTNSGTLAVASGAKLVLGGGGSLGGALTGAGTIDFAAPLTLTSGATLGVSVLVDTANLTLGSGENLANGAGHVLEITASASSPVTLAGVGADTISNAGTLLANGPGSVKLETPFINTGHLSVNGGVLTLAGAVTNSGTLAVASGKLSIEEAVSGAGEMTVGAAGTLSLGGAVGASETVDLTHSGLLDLGDPLGFSGRIADFGDSAGIDLLSTPVTSDSYANDVLTLKDGASVVGALHFVGNYTIKSFSIGSDKHGGTMIGSA